MTSLHLKILFILKNPTHPNSKTKPRLESCPSKRGFIFLFKHVDVIIRRIDFINISQLRFVHRTFNFVLLLSCGLFLALATNSTFQLGR
jgi:hypothetical protein